MIRILIDSREALLRELADANSAGLRSGTLYIHEVIQEINIARIAVGAVFTAVLTNGGEQSLLQYDAMYGVDENRKTDGSDAAKAELSAILTECDALGIRVREGKIELY